MSQAVERWRQIETSLETIRTERRQRWLATVLGLAAGALAATLDPLGIVLGGALLALPARSVVRGLLRGAAFGGLVVLGLAVQLQLAGTLGRAVDLGLPFGLAIGIGLGLGLLGGLARGVL